MIAWLRDGPREVRSTNRKPWWLYPNLLSLDAPLVAVAWLYMFAKTWRVYYLPTTTYVTLGLVVWVIYVVDRLLDGYMKSGAGEKLEARHDFHFRYRKAFSFFAVVVGLAALVLVLSQFMTKIYGYAVFGGLMVSGFFTLSLFSNHAKTEIPYSKNIIAGLAFAYGTAMLAFAYTGFEGDKLLQSPELICFVVLCILNISAIDLWEHASHSSDLEIKATDELALTLPLTLLGAAALVFALKETEMSMRPFFYAILTGAGLLQILNRTRARYSADALRVLADVALLVPFLVFWVSSR